MRGVAVLTAATGLLRLASHGPSPRIPSASLDTLPSIITRSPRKYGRATDCSKRWAANSGTDLDRGRLVWRPRRACSSPMTRFSIGRDRELRHRSGCGRCRRRRSMTRPWPFAPAPRTCMRSIIAARGRPRSHHQYQLRAYRRPARAGSHLSRAGTRVLLQSNDYFCRSRSHINCAERVPATISAADRSCSRPGRIFAEIALALAAKYTALHADRRASERRQAEAESRADAARPSRSSPCARAGRRSA